MLSGKRHRDLTASHEHYLRALFKVRTERGYAPVARDFFSLRFAAYRRACALEASCSARDLECLTRSAAL